MDTTKSTATDRMQALGNDIENAVTRLRTNIKQQVDNIENAQNCINTVMSYNGAKCEGDSNDIPWNEVIPKEGSSGFDRENEVISHVKRVTPVANIQSAYIDDSDILSGAQQIQEQTDVQIDKILNLTENELPQSIESINNNIEEVNTSFASEIESNVPIFDEVNDKPFRNLGESVAETVGETAADLVDVAISGTTGLVAAGTATGNNDDTKPNNTGNHGTNTNNNGSGYSGDYSSGGGYSGGGGGGGYSTTSGVTPQYRVADDVSGGDTASRQLDPDIEYSEMKPYKPGQEFPDDTTPEIDNQAHEFSEEQPYKPGQEFPDDTTPDNQTETITETNPDKPTPAAVVSEENTPTHIGGGYSNSTGFTNTEITPEDTNPNYEDTETSSILDTTDSISSIINDKDYTVVPKSNENVTTTSGSAAIPVAAGLSTATAAAFGAKAIIDKKNRDENEDINVKKWDGDISSDVDYNDGMKHEETLDEEELENTPKNFAEELTDI